MKTTFRHLARLAPMLALLAGCASSPRFEAGFGDSVRAAVAAQVANPAAVQNTNPVNGLEGSAARGAQERFEHSYKQPQELAAPVTIVTTR
ncbi:MAG: hypothetical protein ACJ8LG_24165 [Massilia sp.]